MENTVALPTEILIKILSLLPASILTKCQQVSREFNQVISGTTLLAYILELEKWGYEEWDGPCSFHSEIADRLRDLREIQDAWQNPKPRFDGTKTTKLPIKSQLNPANSAQVGVCVNGVYLRRTTTGNPRAPERDVLVDLFKISNDPNNHESTSFRLDFDFTQHYLDVDQKLFVVVKNEKDADNDVYLLSSLDGSDHPKARHSIIRMPQGYNSTSMPFPAIIGPFLFLHFAFIADTVPDFQACKLYHWPSGSCVKTWMSKDAILLSSEFILVAMGRYDYPNEKGKDCLELWSIPNTFDPRNPEIPSLCATFQLANFDRQSSREIYLKSEGRTVETEFKFRPAPQQLVMISHEGHEFVVSINALLTRIPTQTTHLDGPPIYSWTEWGPQSTLLLPQNYFREMIIWSGNRIVFPDKIWDFSPYAARGPNAPKMSPVTWKCNQCERNCPYSVSKGRHLPFRVIPWKYPKPKEMFLLTMVLVETVNGPQLLEPLSSRSGNLNVNIISIPRLTNERENTPVDASSSLRAIKSKTPVRFDPPKLVNIVAVL